MSQILRQVWIDQRNHWAFKLLLLAARVFHPDDPLKRQACVAVYTLAGLNLAHLQREQLQRDWAEKLAARPAPEPADGK